MSVGYRGEVRLRLPRLSIPDWSGTLDCTDEVTGGLVCLATGWRLKLVGTRIDRGLLYLSAMFDRPVFSDDAFPGSIEQEIAKRHERQGEGYVSLWVGDVRSDDFKAWKGELADHYGGRLVLAGKTHGGGVTSLRAVARIEGQKS